MNPSAVNRPVIELQTFSPAQYDLVFYFLVIAAFALAASFVRTWTTRTEISARFRPAVVASLCITGVAALSYLVLIIKWDTGYALTNGAYTPGPEALFSVVPRYMDWTVTVPLLTVELLAVCSLTGRRARNTRATTMAAAVLMILTGFIGAKVIDEGTNRGALWLWGLISTLFLVYLYTALILAVRDTVVGDDISAQAKTTLQAAVALLLTTFVVYPLVYAIPVFFNPTAKWTVAIQIAFSCADITAKVGFGALIHKVAKLRTADDVNAGMDTSPEPIWISNVKYSSGVAPAIRGVLDGQGGTSGWTTADGVDRTTVQQGASAVLPAQVTPPDNAATAVR